MDLLLVGEVWVFRKLRCKVFPKRSLHQPRGDKSHPKNKLADMLRGAPLELAATKVGERIRVAIEKARFEWDGKIISVTISVGVSALRPDEKVPDFMVRRADEALYQAKRTGKNRVCQSS